MENIFPGCVIILFGSYSRGEDVAESDIDIAIVGSKGKEDNLRKYEKILERVINLNFYKAWDMDNNLRNNILNGIVLGGGVEIEATKKV